MVEPVQSPTDQTTPQPSETKISLLESLYQMDQEAIDDEQALNNAFLAGAPLEPIFQRIYERDLASVGRPSVDNG